ncbi:MAG: ATP-binding protein [Desulfobacteraceae bacterium]|nr:MAG: ATP-binding protein [Desulfobacteraceae bacterium]
MYFIGREREISRINRSLSRGKNIVVTGKYGVGKTALSKRVTEINAEKWRFLFADFSQTPAKVCHDLLARLPYKKKAKGRPKYLAYKQRRSLLGNLAEKDSLRFVLVLDDLGKLTPQKMNLIRWLVWEKRFLFIIITERFLDPDDFTLLRACLYPCLRIDLQNLGEKKAVEFLRHFSDQHGLNWTANHIRMLATAAKGYPLGMKDFVIQELKKT